MNKPHTLARLVVLMAGLIAGPGCTILPAAQADETPSVAIKTAAVQVMDIGDTLLSYGVLEPDPDQILSLSLPHAGLINRVWVRLGQRVKVGDKLLEVITAPDSRMQFLQAQSAVDFAKRELARKQQLLKEQLATKTEVDAAEKALQDAQSTLDAMRKRGLDKVEETLSAPTNGIITRLDVSQGQRMPADTTAALIATEDRLIARLGVEPEDLDLIQAGSPVTITPVFIPDVIVSSQIREVHAMIDPNTHLVEVLAPIPGQEVNRLVLGSRVIGNIQLPTHAALVVPRSAVLSVDNESFLYTVNDSKAQRITVQTGVQRDDIIEVSGAISAGDMVVISGNYELSDGMAVREASQ